MANSAADARASELELRRQLLAQRGLDSAAVRAKAGETRRHTLASRPDYGRQVGAKISEAKRRRDGELTEQLRQLPVTAWDVLPEPDRSMVRRYYGLEGEQPATFLELMVAFRLQHRQIRRMVSQGVSRLVDPTATLRVTRPHDERVRRRTAVVAGLAALGANGMAEFSELDRQIIARSYGIDGEQRGSQRGIARSLGITGRRVREALAKAAAVVENA